jgi:hypothetical protein
MKKRTEEISEEATMGSYSEMIAERAADEVNVRCIRNLMEGMHFTAGRAMDVLKIPEDKRAQYTAILEEEKTSKKTI